MILGARPRTVPPCARPHCKDAGCNRWEWNYVNLPETIRPRGPKEIFCLCDVHNFTPCQYGDEVVLEGVRMFSAQMFGVPGILKGGIV